MLQYVGVQRLRSGCCDGWFSFFSLRVPAMVTLRCASEHTAWGLSSMSPTKHDSRIGHDMLDNC